MTADFTNVAVVTGQPPVGTAVTDSDPSSVDVISPAIDIRKQVEGADTRQVLKGSDVTFEIEVKNTGDVDLTEVAVTDALAPTCAKAIGSLAAGASQTYSCTVAGVTADFTNVAVVTGQPPVGTAVTDSDPSSVDVISPAIDIRKQVEGADTRQVLKGSDVTFEIEVKNTGDVDLTEVAVTDALAPTCAKSIGSLAAGASQTYSCTVAGVTADFTNVAVVTGQPPVGTAVTDSDPSSVDVISPAIDIRKQVEGADTRQVLKGSDVTFEIEVKNTGDVDLTEVAVTDALAPTCAKSIGSLAAGASQTYSCTVAGVTADFTNVAVVTGQPPVGTAVTDSDPSSVDVISPAIDIEKHVSVDGLTWLDADDPTGPEAEVGKLVHFRFIITNTGDVSLANVVVTDQVLMPSVAIAVTLDCGLASSEVGVELAPGQTIVCSTSSSAVVGQYKNLGSVSAAPPLGPAVGDTDPAHYFGKDVGGCTRTQGYWSTHWIDNGKQYDPTWATYHNNGLALFFDEPVPDGVRQAELHPAPEVERERRKRLRRPRPAVHRGGTQHPGRGGRTGRGRDRARAGGRAARDRCLRDGRGHSEEQDQQRPVDGAGTCDTARPVQQRPARAWSLRVERGR